MATLLSRSLTPTPSYLLKSCCPKNRLALPRNSTHRPSSLSKSRGPTPVCALVTHRAMSASSTAKTALVVWLHGLGDTGAGWSDLQYMLGPKLPHVKWVFPDAPVQSVTCNGGMMMPSWFDLPEIPLRPNGVEKAEDFQSAVKRVQSLLKEEIESAGVSSSRVVIGGFSQGGAIATEAMLQYPEKLAAGVNLSGWLVDAGNLPSRISPANNDTPLLWGHGDMDPTVFWTCQKEGLPVLRNAGVNVEDKVYEDMGHSACDKEFQDVLAYLTKHIPENPETC